MNSVMRFKPVDQIFDRVDASKTESDTAYFNALMYAAEMVAKIAIGGMVALIKDDKDRHRYRHEYALVRANGIGIWARELNSLLTGPSAQHIYTEAQQVIWELTKKHGSEVAWQYRAIHDLHRSIQVVYPKVDPLPKRIFGRIWFEYLALLRNKTSGHGATTAQQCADASATLASSVRTFASNFSLFKRPWARLHRNLSGKWRVYKIAGNRDRFSELWSNTDISLPENDGVYIGLDENYVYVDLVHCDVDASDFYLPNGGFTGNRFEVLSYITNERKFPNAQPYMKPPGLLPGSETEGLPELDVVGDTFTNLPSLPVGYVERGDLQSVVLSLLTNRHRYPIITLKGRGGIGKTSLALKTLRDLTASGQYEFIFWISARDIDLKLEGPKPVRPNVVTKNDIAKEFSRLLPPIEGVSALSHIEAALREPTGESPYLFVFDNFETIRNPLEVFIWIDTHVRPPNKVLITTRIKKFKADFPVEVGGMDNDEARELIDITARRLKITNLVNEEYKLQLIDEAGGHPYIIKLILGEVAKNRSIRKPGRLVASRDEVLTALFERTYRNLSPLAQRVFLTVCSWRSIIPLLALKAVLLRGEEPIDVQAAIDEIHLSSLIEVTTSERDDQDFIKVPLAASAFGRQKLKVSPFKTQVTVDAQLLYKFGAIQQIEIKHGIEPRIDRFIGNLRKQVNNEKILNTYAPMLEFIARQHPPAWFMMADCARRVADGASIDDIEKQYLLNYLESGVVDGDNRKVAWRRLAELAKKVDDVLGQVHACVELATLPESDIDDISRAANEVNSVLYGNQYLMDTEEKRVIVAKVAEAMHKKLDEADADDCSRLAWLYLHLQDEESARDIIQRGLDINPDNEHCLNLKTRILS